MLGWSGRVVLKQRLTFPLCPPSAGQAAILRSDGTRSGEARMAAFWFTTQVRRGAFSYVLIIAIVNILFKQCVNIFGMLPQ